MSCQQKKHFTTGVVTVGIERVPFSYSLNGVCGPRFTFVYKSNAHVSNCELCTPSLLPLNRSFFRTAVIKFRILDIGCQPMKFSLQKKYPAAGGLLRFVSTFRAIRSNYHRNSKALPLNLLERSKLCRCLTLPVDSHLNGSLGRSAILIKITIKLQRYRV